MTIEAKLTRRRRALAAAFVVSAATTLVTGLAHSLGGGAAPDTLLLATAFVATLLVLTLVVGGRGSVARQLVGVVLAQLVQHVLYSLPDAGSHAQAHVHDAAAELQSAVVLHEHASMPLAHAVAGVITLLLLRCTPRALSAMVAAMSPRLAAVVLTWVAPRARRRASVTAARPASRPALELLHAALVTRGPPLALV